MSARCFFTVICALNVILSILAINHWVLNENGKILQKIDSPFYMREPNNLIAFMDQIRYNEIIENTYLELLRQREFMVEQINFSIQFGMEVIEQAKCALDFYQLENTMTYTRITKEYLKRINVPKRKDNLGQPKLPLCWKYNMLKSGICCYDHLESLLYTDRVHIEPEDELRSYDLEFIKTNYVTSIAKGIKENPNSWKYHTLASYYWRMMGDAHQAMECAKRGVMLAPREYKDIPLLSLGTILYRSEELRDAEVLLSAAVDHAPDIPENHFALGTTLAMIYEFNRSIEHFEIAEKMNPNYEIKTQHLRNFISCVENLNKKTAKMYSYVEFIKKEVNGLRSMKNKITSSHEKLIQQQVPLGARYYDVSNEELLNRGQYCSTRTLSGTDEPVLFCDFYSDLQMRLESKEVDIESLERELTANSEAIIKKLSSNFHTQFAFDKSKTKKKDS